MEISSWDSEHGRYDQGVLSLQAVLPHTLFTCSVFAGKWQTENKSPLTLPKTEQAGNCGCYTGMPQKSLYFKYGSSYTLNSVSIKQIIKK